MKHYFLWIRSHSLHSIFFFFFYCLFSFYDNLLSIIFIFWPLNNRNIHYTFTYNTTDKIFKKRQLINKFKDKYLSIKHRDGIILPYLFLGLWVWRAKTVHFIHFKGYQRRPEFTEVNVWCYHVTESLAQLLWNSLIVTVISQCFHCM